MSVPATVVILGEDNAHVRCAYRAIVDQFGIHGKKIRIENVCAGRGDAKQYVLSQLQREAVALRARPPSARLIVILDADTESVARRRQEVLDLVAKANLPEDRVAIVVPRRNIETWREFARCNPVDEETDYKHGPAWTKECYRLVGQLLGEEPIPKPNPPESLETAREEMRSKIRQ